MRNLLILFAGALLCQPVVSQTLYELPFASSGNAIELAVVNTSAIEASDVTVHVQSAPKWLTFATREQVINAIGSGEERAALFSFAVEKSAPVGTEETITFDITTSTGQHWTKRINITVAAPETFELFQNYPNPFNPTTTIAYQLPIEGKVNLKLYDMLGREVLTIVDTDRKAGFHEEVVDASQLASGIYIYRLSSGSFSAIKRLMLLK